VTDQDAQPLCEHDHHDARRRRDGTNKARVPCPTCGGTWVDYGRDEGIGVC
jgi:hypothetical protein